MVDDGSGRLLEGYLGGYRRFDSFAALCVKKAQKLNASIRSNLVIPYLSVSCQERIKPLREYYDTIINPPLENVPARLAIIRRNEWMVDRATPLYRG